MTAFTNVASPMKPANSPTAIGKKFKKVSKINLPNVGMGGWMKALADKIHKQRAHSTTLLHFPQPSVPYISDMLVGTM